MTWYDHWNGIITKQPEQDTIGFVYIITHLTTNKKYIGIKKFWKTIRRKPLKGTKRVRISIVESNWRTYNTSNKELSESIKKNPENYKKILWRVCYSVTEMKVYEAYIQLQYYTEGRWDELINEMINLRIRIRKTK